MLSNNIKIKFFKFISLCYVILKFDIRIAINHDNFRHDCTNCEISRIQNIYAFYFEF